MFIQIDAFIYYWTECLDGAKQTLEEIYFKLL